MTLQSPDSTNRLTRECVAALQSCIRGLSSESRPLVITGNPKYFSVGADLAEIAQLDGPAAYEFSKLGQELMRSIAEFPAPVIAAVSGYCMGGGLDLALACHTRIASTNAVFGHRGAALGLLTGWGGTQRLPRLVGKAIALQMFLSADKVDAVRAESMGLIDGISDDPVAESLRSIQRLRRASVTSGPCQLE